MSAGIDIRNQGDGTWSVSINGSKPRHYSTLDEALIAAGNVTFSAGESPASWRVLITENPAPEQQQTAL